MRYTCSWLKYTPHRRCFIEDVSNPHLCWGPKNAWRSSILYLSEVFNLRVFSLSPTTVTHWTIDLILPSIREWGCCAITNGGLFWNFLVASWPTSASSNGGLEQPNIPLGVLVTPCKIGVGYYMPAGSCITLCLAAFD